MPPIRPSPPYNALATLTTRRALSTTPLRSTPFSRGPAPPQLPKEEQELFEQLQKQSTGAFSTPSQPATEKNAAEASASTGASNGSFAAWRDQVTQVDTVKSSPKIAATGEGEELHPHIRRGAPPEFAGDVNPKTGEVGGPKNEPLRWGHGGDYSYNGRVTDF